MLRGLLILLLHALTFEAKIAQDLLRNIHWLHPLT
jgi:hypothetical protein